MVETCNTAANAQYITVEERNIIWLHNLARFDGALFVRTFLLEYIEDNNIKISYCSNSLMYELRKNAIKLTLLRPDEHIYELAKDFAIWSGKKGIEGH